MNHTLRRALITAHAEHVSPALFILLLDLVEPEESGTADAPLPVFRWRHNDLVPPNFNETNWYAGHVYRSSGDWWGWYAYDPKHVSDVLVDQGEAPDRATAQAQCVAYLRERGAWGPFTVADEE